jgi:hypothetical protein
MQCPPRIAELITKILERGILRIRVLGWDGQADACAVEADHLHNLPDLLRDFRREKLDYYLRIERGNYSSQVPESPLVPIWNELDQELANLLAQT